MNYISQPRRSLSGPPPPRLARGSPADRLRQEGARRPGRAAKSRVPRPRGRARSLQPARAQGGRSGPGRQPRSALPTVSTSREGDRLGPAANGDVCRYEGANYHFIQLEIEWEGGAETMKMYGTVQSLADQKMKGVLKLGDGSELTGEWDEAKVSNCCRFLAMRGDQLVTVDIAGSNAMLEQAAAIADAELKRIEKPLTVDGAAGVTAAIAATRRVPRNATLQPRVARRGRSCARGSPRQGSGRRRQQCTCAYTLVRRRLSRSRGRSNSASAGAMASRSFASMPRWRQAWARPSPWAATPARASRNPPRRIPR